MKSTNFLKWLSITSVALVALIVSEFKYKAFSSLQQILDLFSKYSLAQYHNYLDLLKKHDQE